jgi:hypothetical protein
MTIPPDLAFLAPLIETLASTWPAGSAEDCPKAARAALEALEPRDLVEAMLAARMIAAHHATMDGYRRAMQPGVSDAEAVRLRNNAIAAARSFDAALRTLEKRRAATDKPSQPHKQAAPQPRPSEPAPGRLTRGRHAAAAEDQSPEQAMYSGFTPEEIAAAEHELATDPIELKRAELAKRIPLHRWEDMTMEERGIAYAPSSNRPCENSPFVEPVNIGRQQGTAIAKTSPTVGFAEKIRPRP